MSEKCVIINGKEYAPKEKIEEDYVIVRTYSAGVFAGNLVRREGKEVELANARRIWLKGIWDTPYEIPSEDNFDRYPLIGPVISSKEKTVNLMLLNLLEKILNRLSLLKII